MRRCRNVGKMRDNQYLMSLPQITKGFGYCYRSFTADTCVDLIKSNVSGASVRTRRKANMARASSPPGTLFRGRCRTGICSQQDLTHSGLGPPQHRTHEPWPIPQVGCASLASRGRLPASLADCLLGTMQFVKRGQPGVSVPGAGVTALSSADRAPLAPYSITSFGFYICVASPLAAAALANRVESLRVLVDDLRGDTELRGDVVQFRL